MGYIVLPQQNINTGDFWNINTNNDITRNNWSFGTNSFDGVSNTQINFFLAGAYYGRFGFYPATNKRHLSFGKDSGTNLLVNYNAFGNNAGTSSGDNTNSFGTSANYLNNAGNVNSFGNQAGYSNSGSYCNFFGENAGYSNAGANCIAIGRNSLLTNQKANCITIGDFSGGYNQGQNLIAIGINAGGNNSNNSNYSIYIGTNSGLTGNTIVKSSNTFIGHFSGQNQNGTACVAIGLNSLLQNTGSKVLALGNSSGVQNSISNCTIINTDYLPAYLNHAQAQAAILPTGISGNTYLFRETTANQIGYVTIP